MASNDRNKARRINELLPTAGDGEISARSDLRIIDNFDAEVMAGARNDLSYAQSLLMSSTLCTFEINEACTTLEIVPGRERRLLIGKRVAGKSTIRTWRGCWRRPKHNISG